ncbi:MAG: hypothetical protein JO021_16635 [Alphaproteobacteria bacterium]|nr:hypothetical protein [Alphaproteobacteria bacterium]
MVEETTGARPRAKPTPSAEIKALDTEIRTRFARRTDALESFLGQWIKLDESQAMFFAARGNDGENYLQYLLAAADIPMALGVSRMCGGFAGTTDSERIEAFLNNIDRGGNDMWHYLAANLTESEDEDSLEIAKLLIQLEIDYCRKNDKDESPLARLLIPEPKWQSVNSMLRAKTLTLNEIEISFPERVAHEPQLRAEIMTGIFFSDIESNQGRLIQHMLEQALSPKMENAERAKIAEVFFDYAGGKRVETVLMRLVESELKDVLERLLLLLQRVAEESTAAAAATDLQLAKGQQQVFLYRRLGRRNRVFQSLMHKCIAADKPNYITSILGMLRNEDIVVLRRNGRSESGDREILVIDKTSPAPANPAMSLVLQQDVRGNTPFHAAVLASKLDCLRKIFFGLSLIDTYAIIKRIPNRYGLTVADLMSPKDAYGKLSVEIKAGRLTVEDAQAMLNTIKVGDRRVHEYMAEAMRKAEDVIARTGGAKVAKPTFDLARIPTVQLMLQQQGGAKPAAPAGAPAGAAGAAPRPPGR